MLSEIESQKNYAVVFDQMATYQCLTLSNPQASSFIQELKKEAPITLKNIAEMVNNELYMSPT